MITKRAFIDLEVGLLRQLARHHLSKDMCDAVHKLFPPDFRMITKKSSRIVKAAARIEAALEILTYRHHKLCKLFQHGKKLMRTAILKNSLLAKKQGRIFRQRNGTFLGSYADDIVRAINRNFSDSSQGNYSWQNRKRLLMDFLMKIATSYQFPMGK